MERAIGMYEELLELERLGGAFGVRAGVGRFTRPELPEPREGSRCPCADAERLGLGMLGSKRPGILR